MLKDARRLTDKNGRPRLGKEMLKKLRADVKWVCQKAKSKGYLSHAIWEGLDRPAALKPTAPKLTFTIPKFAECWGVLEERDRLAFELVTFVGLRESDVFGLKCGDVIAGGLSICRSFYRGSINPPKNEVSFREVGAPREIVERLREYIVGLSANGPDDWLFPSTKITTPEWPYNAINNRIRPRLTTVGRGGLTFAILRRIFSSANKKEGTDLELMAHQQGHHLSEYVQPDRAQLAEETEKLYAKFKANRVKGRNDGMR